MGYKVIDFNNETVRVGFSTEGAAWNWLYFTFTKEYIKDAELKVVKEEDNDKVDKYDEHIPKETIALLNEAAEAMNNAFHIGSRVKYIHGKQAYRVIDCTYIPTKHEMYYTLSAYQNDVLSGHETPKVYNVAHHRLKQIKRR